MKIGLAAVSAVGIVIVSAAFLSANSVHEQENPSLPATSINSQVSHQDVEDDASGTFETVNEIIKTLDTHVVSSITDDSPLSTPPEEFNLDSIPEEIKMNTLEGQDYIGEKSSLKTLRHTFDSDLEDGVQSFDAENKMLEMVSGSERLSAYALADTKCKTNNCKVTFFVLDQEQHEQLTNDLLITMQEDHENINVQIDPVDSEGKANFYIGLTAGKSKNL